MGKEVKDATIAIQGCGNVGGYTADFLYRKGARIIAISDISGGLYAKEGLPVPEIFDFVSRGNLLSGYPSDKLQRVDNPSLLTLPVDILIPAAVEDVITEKNARNISARMVIEAANGPTTPKGDEILSQRKVPVIPDILTNSGGVVASYIEWRNAKSGNQTSAEEVYDFIDGKMEKTFQQIQGLTKEHKTNFREGAYLLSVSELVSAMRERSWI